MLCHRDGTRINVEVSGATIRHAGELATFHIVRNIMERKHATNALKESKSRFRDLAQLLPEIVFEADAHGRLTFVNRNAFDSFGYTREDFFRGLNIFDMIVPGEREKARGSFTRVLRGDDIGLLEGTALRKDGSTFPVIVRATAGFRGGKTVALRGIVIDISDRKKIEEALRESEEKFRTITASAHDAIIMMDSEGMVSYWNDAAERIFGYSSKEILGKDLHKIIGPEKFYEAHRENLSRFARAGRGRVIGRTLEMGAVRKDGVEFPVELSVSSVRMKGKWHAIAIVRDLTSRRNLEIQLKQAQKMEAIGTLAGGIAHDFNNILGVILGCTELSLLDAPEGTASHHYLTEVFKAGNRAKDLVKQILTFSRHRERNRKPLNPGVIVKEAVKLLRASLPSTIWIHLNIDKDPGAVLADPIEIHQVMMNLCTNAAHAMREKGGVLEVRLSNVELDPKAAKGFSDLSPGSYIKMTVSDTGHGMEPGAVERIFDPYFTTKGPGEGTGLGLAVVRGIVKGCGGDITVRSEPGKGSRFQIFLPRIGPGKHPVAAGRPESFPTGDEKILVVDDEGTLVHTVREMLERLGYGVETRTSSPDALKTFGKAPDTFDLLITDQTMPHMTGVELAEAFMNIRPDIPIILCSGYNESMTKQKAKAIGIRDFVMKPLEMKELAEATRKALDRKRGDAAFPGARMAAQIK